MKRSLDGGSREDERPRLALALFEIHDKKEESSLLFALKDLCISLGPLIDKTPFVTSVHLNNPLFGDMSISTMLPEYRKAMDAVGGEIVLGVTELPLFDPGLGRNIFGQGIGSGLGIFSLTRFREAGGAPGIYYNRLSKEIIKILGLNCGLPHCPDKNCILAHHRFMEDLDLNKKVCNSCLQEFADEFNRIYGQEHREE